MAKEHFQNKDELSWNAYGCWHTFYGSVEIDLTDYPGDKCFHWKIKVLQCPTNSGVRIGIGYENKKSIKYFYGQNGNKSVQSVGVVSDKYGPPFGSGDIIEMTLNCSNHERRLSFKKNGFELGVAFSDECLAKQKFKLAVRLYSDLNGPSVKLLSFEQLQTDSIQRQLINDVEKKTDTRIQELMEANHRLKVENVAATKVAKDLRSKLNAIEEEMKELQIENKALKKEITNLKLASINPLFYKTWNSKQVISWIVSLEDGRFQKYEKVLKGGIKGIVGKDLNKVNDLVIRYWGIANGQDIECLDDCIQRLCLSVEGNAD